MCDHGTTVGNSEVYQFRLADTKAYHFPPMLPTPRPATGTASQTNHKYKLREMNTEDEVIFMWLPDRQRREMYRFERADGEG